MEDLARKFHEAYERLAPRFGYETRSDTKAFDADSPNGKLMIAVCGELLDALTAPDRDDLHRKIMNIPVDKARINAAFADSMSRGHKSLIHLYNVAFRDARHAAAEIVLKGEK